MKKLTRKKLRKLIEAFIVDPYGNAKYIGKKGGANYRHNYADEIMVRSDPFAFQEPEIARKIYDLYDKDDDESKIQAIRFADSLGAFDESHPDLELNPEQAELDIKTRKDKAFDAIKASAEEHVDRVLLKSFMDDLHRKGRLIPDLESPPIDIYDISDMFVKKYPNETYPDLDDYEAVGGLDIYGGDLIVTGYDPNRPPEKL